MVPEIRVRREPLASKSNRTRDWLCPM